MTERSRALPGVLVATVLLVAAGCSDDEPTLLADDDLPSAVESSDGGHAGFPGITGCSQLVDQQDFAGTDAWAADGYQYWTYRLESGEAVSAALFDFGDGDQRATWVQKIQDAVEECGAGAASSTDVAALEDLPTDVFGYEASERFNDGRKQGVLVFGPAEDDRLVAVGMSTTDGTEPSVDDVVKLLEQAQEAAPEITELSSKESALEEDG
jgi:hypothetical protein